MLRFRVVFSARPILANRMRRARARILDTSSRHANRPFGRLPMDGLPYPPMLRRKSIPTTGRSHRDCPTLHRTTVINQDDCMNPLAIRVGAARRIVRNAAPVCSGCRRFFRFAPLQHSDKKYRDLPTTSVSRMMRIGGRETSASA